MESSVAAVAEGVGIAAMPDSLDTGVSVATAANSLRSGTPVVAGVAFAFVYVSKSRSSMGVIEDELSCQAPRKKPPDGGILPADLQKMPAETPCRGSSSLRQRSLSTQP